MLQQRICNTEVVLTIFNQWNKALFFVAEEEEDKESSSVVAQASRVTVVEEKLEEPRLMGFLTQSDL